MAIFLFQLSQFFDISGIHTAKASLKYSDVWRTVNDAIAKGQLISKGLLGVIVSTKKPTKFL